MTVEEIKVAIADLPDDAKVELAAWLNSQTMDDWDQEMARDFSPGGRGQLLLDKVKAEIEAGGFRSVSERGRARE